MQNNARTEGFVIFFYPKNVCQFLLHNEEQQKEIKRMSLDAVEMVCWVPELSDLLPRLSVCTVYSMTQDGEATTTSEISKTSNGEVYHNSNANTVQPREPNMLKYLSHDLILTKFANIFVSTLFSSLAVSMLQWRI